MTSGRDIIDALLEAPIVPSFTRIGSATRSRTDQWRPLGEYDLTGRRYLVTGSTSGLGLEAATQLARCGADVIVNGRSEKTANRAAQAIADLTGTDSVTAVAGDLGEFDQVRHLADAVRGDRLDGVLHNAGALTAERTENSTGMEVTVASQVAGPFLLTSLLLEPLADAAPGRVITMSSGGMYTAGLSVDGLEMSTDEYGGSEQYARAKRAQVTINEMWAELVDPSETVFHALHPGWADTPGVEAALPTFRRVVGPLLRTPAEGADTMVWLAADDGEPRSTTGGFWLDRRRRSLHKLGTTRRTDTPERRTRLWNHLVDVTGATVERRQ